VETLANECGDSGLLVRFLAYTGLRWGEATALLVGDLDFDRRRIHVARAASEVEGRLLLDTTKTNKSRVVALPAFLAEELMTATTGKKPDHLVFGNRRGGLLRNRNFTTRVLAPAAAEVGLNGLTVHALRHTAASLAISAGANVKVVQQMLGHATASMTLDLYGHLFPDQLDDIASRLDAIGRSVKVRYPGDGSCPVGGRHPQADFARRGRPRGVANAPSSLDRSCRIGWTRITLPSTASWTEPATIATCTLARAQRRPHA
jgi:integrase